MSKKNKKLITCEDCDGRCCRTFAIHIPTPKKKKDYEDIKWFLYHKPAKVYIDNENDWLVRFDIPCSKLDLETGRCTIYDKRPPMCREGKFSECEMNVKETKVLFNDVEEYEDWLEGKHLNRR